MTDVTPQIEAHLMDAATLVIASRRNRTGDYAIMAKIVVNPDGSFMLAWDSYGPD